MFHIYDYSRSSTVPTKIESKQIFILATTLSLNLQIINLHQVAHFINQLPPPRTDQTGHEISPMN